MARTDFRAQAARRLSEDTELSPAIVSLLSPDSPTRSVGVRIVAVDHIEPNPEQPRLVFEQAALDELAASIREHGVLQPILVRPLGPNTYQIVAGERRWRASRQAGLETIPALIEDIDDDTALEIAIIENLQREDLTPLDEAAMYDRMVHEHGYSIRKLADKLGKDKGYLENRLRLADAPPEIRELVSLRKDSLSHAYELMKVEDPKKRRRLAEQVARGELTLIKLRDKIEGRRPRAAAPFDDGVADIDETGRRRDRRLGRDGRRVMDDAGVGADAPADRRLAGQREAGARGGGRRAHRRPWRSGSPRRHRRHRPGEPREVPDDRQAPTGERDRDGPERRRRVLALDQRGRRSGPAHSSIPASHAAASSPTPIAWSCQARSIRALSPRRPIATPSATMQPAPTAMASAPTGAPAAASVTIAAPTTAAMSTRLDRPRPLEPEPDRDGIDPGRRVALEVGPGVGDGEPGPGHDGDGQQHGEGGRQAAGRAKPAEHG